MNPPIPPPVESPPVVYESSHAAVQNIFISTSCYDLMQQSSKAIVFETSIPFQLAFFALVEHDAEIAPLWDPERKTFVGMMTISDYIQSLQVCRRQGVSMQDLASRTITEMMQSPAMIFRHGEFESIDAEDSIQQLCLLLYRLQVDYVPVVDPDDGTLVSILGYLDIVHLMDQAAKQHPHLFAETIELLCVNSFVDVVTAPRTAMLCDVLTVLADRNIAAMPITDENGKVIGLYHKNDVTFVTRATDSEAVLSNLSELTVGDAVALQQQQLQSGEPMTTTPHVLVTCSLHDRLSVVLNAMMLVRSTVVVCVEDSGSCLGVIGIKDLIRYYFDGGVR